MENSFQSKGSKNFVLKSDYLNNTNNSKKNSFFYEANMNGLNQKSLFKHSNSFIEQEDENENENKNKIKEKTVSQQISDKEMDDKYKSNYHGKKNNEKIVIQSKTINNPKRSLFPLGNTSLNSYNNFQNFNIDPNNLTNIKF